MNETNSYTSLHFENIDSRPEVEIYVDGSRCSIDGMWYKPQDSVVVLDAAIGKYKAKYLFLANDEVNIYTFCPQICL